MFPRLRGPLKVFATKLARHAWFPQCSGSVVRQSILFFFPHCHVVPGTVFLREKMSRPRKDSCGPPSTQRLHGNASGYRSEIGGKKRWKCCTATYLDTAQFCVGGKLGKCCPATHRDAALFREAKNGGDAARQRIRTHQRQCSSIFSELRCVAHDSCAPTVESEVTPHLV